MNRQNNGKIFTVEPEKRLEEQSLLYIEYQKIWSKPPIILSLHIISQHLSTLKHVIMPNKLAIIIPAYKDTYLDETLNSLLRQTNKDFSIYIGDDNSPYNLIEIISKYSKSLNITYKRFPSNIGGEDLVQQWNRCLQMMEDEEFFCLFSDDDIMEAACIENFRKALELNAKFDVFHFDINIIDSNGDITTQCPPYPSTLSADKFLYLLYTNRIDARMPEFIFKTQHFHSLGGFVNFDLAYRSDNATVIVNAKDKGIYTIPEAKILWRNSGINVSANPNTLLKIRRTYASISFFNWLEDYYSNRKEICPFNAKGRLKLIISDILTLTNCVTQEEQYKALKQINRIKHNYLLYLRWKFYIKKKIRTQKK